MSKPIQPTPTLRGDDAKRFLENLDKESTPEEIESFKRAKEIFKKIKFIE